MPRPVIGMPPDASDSDDTIESFSNSDDSGWLSSDSDDSGWLPGIVKRGRRARVPAAKRARTLMQLADMADRLGFS